MNLFLIEKESILFF